jgi:hypothetical protein
MVRNTGWAAKTAAIGIALVSLVGISATRCGGDDDVTEANLRQKMVAAFCGAQAACCASQGFPLSADSKLICEGTIGVLAFNPYPGVYVFNHDIAVACVKAAAAYRCRDILSIETLCRRIFVDPASPTTAPPFAAEGATCALLDRRYTCAFYDGLACIPDSETSSTGTCRKESTGGSCVTFTDCPPTDFCRDSTKTYIRRSADGEPCVVGDFREVQCDSDTCTNAVCAPRVACTLS